MERLTDFELEQWDNQLLICPENANIRKLIDEVKQNRETNNELKMEVNSLNKSLRLAQLNNELLLQEYDRNLKEIFYLQTKIEHLNRRNN